MSAEVAAPRGVLWAALTDTEQIPRWRPGVTGAAPGPAVSGLRRWRCRLRGLPVVLEERQRSAQPGERLRSSLALGLFRFEETITLRPVPGAPERTRLGVVVQTRSEMAVVGGALDRFAVRRFAADVAAANLRALRDFCEAGRCARRGLPAPPPLAAG